ncbi:MAG: tetratricopeptide repeat protein [Rhizobacter sp.]
MGFFSWAKRRFSHVRPGGQLQGPFRSDEADKAARHPPSTLTDPAKLGVECLQVGDIAGALKAFGQALTLHPDSAANHVNLAYVLKQTGAEGEALPHLRQAVALDAQSFDAHYMLGGALEQGPDLEAAAKHLRLALALCADFEPVYTDLCRVLVAKGSVAEARKIIVEAIALNPQNADFHLYLGNLCMSEGNPLEAIHSYRRVLELKPDYAQGHVNLGCALQAQKSLAEAVQSFEAALAIDPSSSDAHAKLGIAQKALGQFGEAEVSLGRALELLPTSAETLNELGMLFQEQGKLDPAIDHYRRAIALRPGLPGGYANLGLALDQKGDCGQALATYRQGLAIKPLPEIHGNLAITLAKLGCIDEAIEHYWHALKLAPDNLNTRCNLASAFGDLGETQQAIELYREVVGLEPSLLIAHSNLLFYLAVDKNCTAAEYLAEAKRFDSKLVHEPLQRRRQTDTRSERRLRVGLVSGDLRTHPVGFFLEGILHHLDAKRFELFAYPTIGMEDKLTARIKPIFTKWTPLKGLSDEVAARKIHADEIDILFDLAGHTAENRLATFAYRPAPVQISWLGYFASTGLSAMDYVLADDISVPPGYEQHFSEKLWRLPQTRLCFTPPVDGSTPDVSPLPALQRGYLTFGCFQRLPKINDAVLALWGKVFEALPTAHLLLQSVQTGYPKAVEQTLARLAQVGISADRVTIRGPVDRNLYLQSYTEVDIVLDTFPFTGGTTTCEALWMGVPTVTLAGDTMIARQGVAMMAAGGLPDWVADSPDDYVKKAVAFASDVTKLARLRSSLRESIQRTALFDVRLFAERLEGAIEGIWQEHLIQAETGPTRNIPNVLTQSVALTAISGSAIDALRQDSSA